MRELEARFWEAAANAALAAQERWAADAVYSSVSAALDQGAGGTAGAEVRPKSADTAQASLSCLQGQEHPSQRGRKGCGVSSCAGLRLVCFRSMPQCGSHDQILLVS